MPDDVAYRLRLTPFLMRGDESGQISIDYELSRNSINADGVRLMREAADEIDRLRAQVARLKDDLTAAHESHGNEVGNLSERLALAMEQRDEARREVCEADTETHGGALLEADRRDWDCFKGTDNAI